MRFKNSIAQGEDSLGKFEVRDNRVPTPNRNDQYLCGSCTQVSDLCVWYLEKPKVDEYISSSPSFILRKARGIGLTCGCYAKLHRQITHIKHGRIGG